MSFLKKLKSHSKRKEGKRPEQQKCEEGPKTEQQKFEEGLNSLRQLSDLEILQLTPQDQVEVQQKRVLYRDILVKRNKRPGSLDDLPGYSALAEGQESKLVVCTSRGLDPWANPWLGTLAIETIEKLEKSHESVFSHFCIDPSFVETMADLGLKMLRTAKVTQERYNQYAQTFQSMDRYPKNVDYATNDVTGIILEIINYFNKHDALHIVIDAMDVTFGGLNSTLGALKKIVIEAKPRVDLLVVAQAFPLELETLDRLQAGNGGRARVLVYTPNMGEGDRILSNVPQIYFS